MAKVQLEAVLKLVDVQINPQVFRKISQAVAGMPVSLGKVNQQLQNIIPTTQKVNRGLKSTGQQLSTNERAARLFLQRMAQFAILLPTFATLNRAIQGSVKFLFDFDSSLRDIVRIDVQGLAGRIEEIGDAAIKTAVEFGVTGTEVLNTVRAFKQAGDTIEESQERARTAILATQISTLSAAQATEVFISASRQFGDVGKNSALVLDKLAKVEDIAAVNAADVADAFRTGGNALAHFAGNIDDSIGLIAALREQTRKSGREVGTFFKTLQTRVFAAGEARDAVESLGVQVENLDGSLRPTLAVLNDLKVRFDTLTQAQQANAAKAIAGVRQFESLIATLNSLEKANEFAKESAQAAGTAEEKRAITDAKLERQLGKLIAQGQALAEAVGDAGLEDALSDVLKTATKILKVFTGLADTIADIGGNITPLLALGGITLGRSVFGLANNAGKGGAPAGPGIAQPGQKGFIGPLTQTQSQLAGLGTQFGRLGNIAKDLALRETKRIQLLTTSNSVHYTVYKVAQAQGQAIQSNRKAMQSHTAAIRQNINALKASESAALKERGNPLRSPGGTLLLSLVGTTLPAAFSFLSRKLDETNTILGHFSAEMLDASSSSLSLAAQFAVLGPEAAAAAAAFGALSNAVPKIINAVDDEFKARNDLRDLIASQNKEQQIITKLGSQTGEGKQFAGGVIDSFVTAIETSSQEGGKKFSAALSKAFDEAGKIAGAAGEDFARAFFSPVINQLAGLESVNALGIDTLSRLKKEVSDLSNLTGVDVLILQQQDLLKARAEEVGTLDELATLTKNVKDGTQSANQSFNDLLYVLGKGSLEFNNYTQRVESLTRSLAELEKIRGLQIAVEEFRTLGLELEVAKAGPEALSDSVVKMTQDVLIAQRKLDNVNGILEQGVGDLFANLKDVGIYGDQTKIFKTIEEGLNTLDPQKIQEFNLFIQQQPEAVRTAVDKLRKLREAQLKNELDFQNKSNALQEEKNKRSKELLEAEAQASRNASAATEMFNAELKQFGDNISADVLQQFQGLSVSDIEDVLDPSVGSTLSQDLQDLIVNAFSNPVKTAENELSQTTAQTQATLNALQRELSDVDSKLMDSANAADFASLTSEKRRIELEIEKTTQQGLIDATKAKIKVVEAERDLAKELAEAEKKRLEALDKLADASRKFDNELRSINRSFEEFTQKAIADLLNKEADARGDLKDAQQEVLDATKELSDAYKDLVEAQFEFNGVIAEAQIKSNMLARDIGMLTGEMFTFDQGLSSIGMAFQDVLNNANITLEKRISLERQLAEETLNFLQQARDEIVNAGVGIFGQTGTENRALGQGIQGLQFVAEQLGGSFENFLNLSQGDFASVTDTLLGLPAEFRQQILDALSFLPSTTNIGGFSVEQLTQAIGQIGAGVAPEVGLPSIEELNTQQVEQLTKLQELALQDAQIQFAQVAAAQQQVELAQEALDAAHIIEERAVQELQAVRQSIVEEKAVLDAANAERRELLDAVVAADDKNTLLQIEKEAQLFAEQNAAFREIGDQIVRGISSAIGARLAVLEAAQNVAQAANGLIPNFAGGNLSPGEAAALLRAGAREKRAMPAGAGLAVANTSEAIIPMRTGGFIPNFQDGSEISAGIAAIKGINETVVAAIARSVTSALADLQTGDSPTPELLQEIIAQLGDLNDTSSDINSSSTTIASNTASTTTGTTTTAATGTQRVEITLQTNQNNTISVTGLDSLRDELEAAIASTTADQVDTQVQALFEQLDEVITALQERGILSAFGQTR